MWKASIVASVLLALSSCALDEDGSLKSSPTIIASGFQFDITSNSGFSRLPNKWIGDTLTIYDYWALVNEPVLNVNGSDSNNTFHIHYVAQVGEIKDWSPTVETRIQIIVPSKMDTISILFHKVGSARPPKAGTETIFGIEDATSDRVLKIGRP